jgi:rhomboid family GlyGly-CTERM serine protease
MNAQQTLTLSRLPKSRCLPPDRAGIPETASAAPLFQGLRKTVQARPELLFFIGALLVLNAPLLVGNCWHSMMLQEQGVLHGEWWRLLTHPFVHVTWYHLLLDATAFLTLYAGLTEKRLFGRLAVVIGAASGSVLLSWMSANFAIQGLCGLSGIAHGLMAVSALEMVAGNPADVTTRRIGWVSFFLVSAKATFEAVTGRMFLGFLDFGMLGDPVAVSHAGGVIGGLAVFLGLGLLRRCSSCAARSPK